MSEHVTDVDASDEQFDTAARLRKAIELARQHDITDDHQIQVPVGELDEVLLELETWRRPTTAPVKHPLFDPTWRGMLPGPSIHLDIAILTATEAHTGQTDKSGAPYILHPLRVMFAMDTDEEMQVAVMHDVVEDTDYSPEGLRNRGFSERVVQAVMALTRMEGETYMDYVARAARDPIARKVKLADIEDNLRPGSTESQRKRYEKAKLHILMEYGDA